MRSARFAVGLVATAALLGPPAGASGAVVEMRVERPCGDSCPNTNEDLPLARFRFRAGAAEANAVRLALEDRTLMATDTAAPVSAGEGCEQVDEHRARCAIAGPVYDVTVDLADGADTFAVSGSLGSSLDGLVSTTVAGGAGADVLHGGGEADLLSGGDGDDTVRGGRGRDILGGGGGRDVLVPRDGEPDRARCGPGRDRVAAPDRADLLLASCERTFVPDELPAQPLLVRRRLVRLAPPCRCRGRVRLFARGRLLGRARIPRRGPVVVSLRRRLESGRASAVGIRWDYSGGRGGYRLLLRPNAP